MKKQIFNLEKAIQRFKWRLTNGQFYPNQNDIEAFKFLIEWVVNQKKQAKNNNYAFQKLYAIHLYHKMLHVHDIKEANRQIAQELDLSANLLYNRLLDHVNLIELSQMLDFIGLKSEVEYKQELKVKTKKLTEQEKAHNQKITQENKELIDKHTEGIWNAEDFFNQLDNQITEALNRFNSIEN